MSQGHMSSDVGRMKKSRLAFSYIVTTSFSTGASGETVGYENFILNSKH